MKNLSQSAVKFAAAILLVSIAAPVTLLNAQKRPTAKGLTEDQKIIHVLNRLGFGARPGDVERVKAMGIDKYIDRQLDPQAIDDSAAEAKVKRLDAFSMSTAELFAKYPNPGALLRQLEGGKQEQADKKAAVNGDAMAPGSMEDEAAQQKATQADQRERREKLQALYKEYDLKPAGQLVPQIAANRVLRAVYSERQLQEAMVDFWQNHFNVYAGKAAVRWYIPSYERDVIRKNALGNFKDLLVGTAEHPAMLFFLDNFESVSPNAQANRGGAGNDRLRQQLVNGELPLQIRERIKQRQNLTDAQLDQRILRLKQAPQQQRAKRGINENYARELMELHTLGVNGGYTQNDIVEVAKAFTGWTIADPRGYRRAASSMIQGTEDQRQQRLQRQAGVPDDTDSGSFYFNERWHERGAKVVLGQKVDEGGINDGLKVLDILVKSPATAHFIAKKLAIKFVSDTPSEALVDRVAKAFQTSGGDIKTTLGAIFTDKEFFAPENYRAKIKTPFELAVSSLRTIGADTNASPAFVAMLTKLGEVPYGYQAPTGYPDTAEDWVNTGALLERLNYAVAVASNRIPGTRVDLKRYAGSTREQVLDRSLKEILDGDVSANTRALLLKRIEQPLPEVKTPDASVDEAEMVDVNMRPGQQGGRRRQARLLDPSGDPEVFKIVSLVLGSPEFQRQ